MGIRLIVEIFDHWQDVGLTAGERNDLLVLAENANDGTRLTWGPVHAPYILKRANKTPEGWKNSIGKLLRKKVLTTHVPGRIKQVAVYHLEPLCPEPPHSGYKGHCTKPVAGSPEDPADEGQPPTGDAFPRVDASPEDHSDTSKEGHLSGNPLNGEQEEGHLSGDPMGNPTGDPLAQEGHLTGAERVTSQVTPTPLYSSFKDSPLSTPSSSVAEDSKEGSACSADGTEGGGGGHISSLEEITKQCERVSAFVDSLDYRGRQPGRQQRLRLGQRVMVAITDGWTEDGLRRYLDISDDPAVRSPASVYLHRLSADELPDASVGVDPQLPPACWDCLGLNPAAATDPALRVNPITCDPCPNCHPASTVLPPACETCLQYNPGAATDVRLRIDVMSFQGDPCPKCHPATVGQSPEVPPACQPCLEENPAARKNIRLRYRIIDGAHQACPDCHPKRIAFLATQDGADGGMWDRAAARAAQRMSTGNWQGAGTDERVAGWAALARDLADKPSTTDLRVQRALDVGRRLQAEEDAKRGAPKPMVAPRRHTPYQNATDQSVYDSDFGVPDPIDQSACDEPL